ncbi:MAG TPA: porin family protein [Bacteroidales bacterium]|nr:porin family protein [Bacteroidales bacterium]
MKTKAIFFAGVIALLACQEMQAQIKYGVRTGLNFRTQSELGELWDNADIYPGFLVGGFLEYSVGASLSLQTELNYETKGEKYDNTLTGIKTTTKRDFDYLSVPLLVKGTFGKELGLTDKWNVTGFAGPYYGYLTSANAKTKIGSTKTDTDLDDHSEKSDWGAIFGGGVTYNLTNGCAIVAELRYEMGLGKIDKDDSDLRNKVIGLSVGYRF